MDLQFRVSTEPDLHVSGLMHVNIMYEHISLHMYETTAAGDQIQDQSL